MTDALLKRLQWPSNHFTSLGMAADVGATVLSGLWAMYRLQGRLLGDL